MEADREPSFNSHHQTPNNFCHSPVLFCELPKHTFINNGHCKCLEEYTTELEPSDHFFFFLAIQLFWGGGEFAKNPIVTHNFFSQFCPHSFHGNTLLINEETYCEWSAASGGGLTTPGHKETDYLLRSLWQSTCWFQSQHPVSCGTHIQRVLKFTVWWPQSWSLLNWQELGLIFKKWYIWVPEIWWKKKKFRPRDLRAHKHRSPFPWVGIVGRKNQW